MRTRFVALAALAAALCVPAGPQAAGPVTAGAFGVVTMTGWGCAHHNLGMDFFWDGGSNFLLQTGYFPTQDPQLSPDCAGVTLWNQFTNLSATTTTPPCPVGSPYEYQTKPDSMAILGNRYTITNTFRFCSGVTNKQTTVITINATTISFTHTDDYSVGVDLRANGTLPRLW